MDKQDVIVGLSALAQETRLDVFRLLVQAGKEGRPAGYLAEQLGLPSATLSFHLSQLKHAGLITFQRHGRSLIYTASFEAMNGLVDYLTENCCGGVAGDCGVGAEPCVPAGSMKTAEGIDA